MSESFLRRLSSLTPNAAGLDRAELLFAAGRASARSRRRWPILCGCLAASQIMTLALLWPRSAPSPATERDSPAIVAKGASADSSAALEFQGATLAHLRGMALAAEDSPPRSTDVDYPVASDPPLRAFGTIPAALLD